MNALILLAIIAAWAVDLFSYYCVALVFGWPAAVVVFVFAVAIRWGVREGLKP